MAGYLPQRAGIEVLWPRPPQQGDTLILITRRAFTTLPADSLHRAPNFLQTPLPDCTSTLNMLNTLLYYVARQATAGR